MNILLLFYFVTLVMVLNIFKKFKFIEMTNIKKIIPKQNLLIHNNYRNKIYNKYKKNKF